ncbi:MAG TPA: glycosyltransferase family 39 protein [Trebonia sp.]|nr:glycosyltransferase family 39 protein [Trebonia sp.]
MNPITARPASDVAAPEQATTHRSVVTYLTWGAPAVVALALGLFEIGVPQLWRDELATWSAASRTLPQLWAMLHNIDAVLGIYYFGLHLWMAVFGDSATAMRVPSVLAMAGAAAVVGLIGRRLGGGVAGLASGLIFALIPSVSRYAQEARPYAFATFFAALATLMFLRAMERPNWSRWAIYAVVLGAAGAANLVALVVASGHLIIILWDFFQRTVRVGGDGTPESGKGLPGGRLAPEGSPLLLVKRFCLAVIVGGLLVSPLVIEGHTQQGWQIGGVATPHVAELIGVSGGLWQELFASVPVAVVVMLLAVASLVAAPDARRRSIALYALAFAIVPVVAVWVISRGPTSYWTFRYMLFTITGWAIGAGLCVSFLAERAKSSTRLARLSRSASPRFAVAAVLVAVVGLVGIHDQLAIRQNEAHNLWAYPEMPSNGLPADYQAAAAVVKANARPGDTIAYEVGDLNHYQVDTSIAYYLGNSAPTPIFQAQTQVQSNSLQPVECIDPSACITGTPRVWVVFVDHLAPDPFSALPTTAGDFLQTLGYQVQTTWQVNGITVDLLTVD